MKPRLDLEDELFAGPHVPADPIRARAGDRRPPGDLVGVRATPLIDRIVLRKNAGCAGSVWPIAYVSQHAT